MDYHVITPTGSDLVLRVMDSVVIIVPPAPSPGPVAQ